MSTRAAWVVVCTLLAACSDDAGDLRRVTFAVEVSGLARDPSEPLVFQTALGWEVTLAAAELSVAALYFRNAAPGSGTTEEQGRVVAQVLGDAPWTIDALDPTPTRVEVSGTAITEPVRSAELWLTEATEGPIADALGRQRALAHLAGTARRGDQTITFDGGLSLPQRNDSRAYEAFQNRRIRRLAADFLPSDQGSLRFALDPSRFLDAVPFDALGPSDGTRAFSSDAEQLQLRNGLAGASGYAFHWED